MYTNNRIIPAMTILILMGISSCSLIRDKDNEAEIIEMRVNHFKQTGFGSAPQLTLLVQEAEAIGGAEWTYFYDNIEGFDYSSGYLYELTVKKETVPNPLQDASSIQYTLQSINAREKVDDNESFEIKLKWGGTNFLNGTGEQFSLLDEYTIDCDNLCEELSLKIENQEEVTGIFLHAPDNELKLIGIQ
ncbi:DUF4377 domain-containing protein [Gramella sp. MAR_2010_147]|uniref:DUF4377 domain-containing protein n=1 Tax=Gramella sp. MAR_2010_147 TaxID=1250205 RepID=UPI00087B363F|nr:DUF4377 domain-containing protein [Gramella sp. MAR_2010_147]SDR87001.1 protein of unknown function [Gramella sp. MAR_2010_147]